MLEHSPPKLMCWEIFVQNHFDFNSLIPSSLLNQYFPTKALSSVPIVLIDFVISFFFLRIYTDSILNNN